MPQKNRKTGPNSFVLIPCLCTTPELVTGGMRRRPSPPCGGPIIIMALEQARAVLCLAITCLVHEAGLLSGEGVAIPRAPIYDIAVDDHVGAAVTVDTDVRRPVPHPHILDGLPRTIPLRGQGVAGIGRVGLLSVMSLTRRRLA